MSYFLASALYLAGICCGLLYSQSTHPIHGEVVGIPVLAQGWEAELFDPQRHSPIERVPIGSNGAFQFHTATNNMVEVRILDERQQVVTKEWVNPTQGQFGVTIRLRERSGERPSSGSVSAYRLQHRVPKRAMQEFQRAEKCWARKELAEAIAHLERAVAEDPGFLEALNNLGTRYMQARQPQKAVDWFRRAAAVDPSTPAVRINLAIALLHAGQPAEAEQQIRRALEREPSDTARQVLYMSLRAQGKPLPPADRIQ